MGDCPTLRLERFGKEEYHVSSAASAVYAYMSSPEGASHAWNPDDLSKELTNQPYDVELMDFETGAHFLCGIGAVKWNHGGSTYDVVYMPGR